MGSQLKTNCDVHSSAVIDPTAVIDPSVIIGPGCFIGPNVHIVSETLFINHVPVPCHTTLRLLNQLYPFCVIGVDTQDKKYDG